MALDRAVERRIERIRFILNLKEGRAVLWDILQMCHYGMSPFTPGDPHQTSFIAGKQKVGEGTMQLINAANPAAFFTMSNEAAKEAEHDRRNPTGNDDDPYGDGTDAAGSANAGL